MEIGERTAQQSGLTDGVRAQIRDRTCDRSDAKTTRNLSLHAYHSFLSPKKGKPKRWHGLPSLRLVYRKSQSVSREFTKIVCPAWVWGVLVSPQSPRVFRTPSKMLINR
jgi:hypothetical protein